MAKVYTKTGDRGTTGLIGGTRVEKHHLRLEAYGTVDELSSHIGLLRSYPIDERSVEVLIRIQKQLFVLSSYLATDTTVSSLKSRLDDKEVEFLEAEIDRMEEKLPPMKYFILPGGHHASAQCNVTRTVCRRAERRINAVVLQSVEDEKVLRYINRLSDYLFVLSRHLSDFFNEKEIIWMP